MNIKIKNRWTGEMMHTIDSPDLRSAVIRLIASDADLSGAHLSDAALIRADLSGANLIWANLSGAKAE